MGMSYMQIKIYKFCIVVVIMIGHMVVVSWERGIKAIDLNNGAVYTWQINGYWRILATGFKIGNPPSTNDFLI